MLHRRYFERVQGLGADPGFVVLWKCRIRNVKQTKKCLGEVFSQLNNWQLKLVYSLLQIKKLVLRK